MSALRLTRDSSWPGLAGLVLFCLLQLCCTLTQAAITVPPLQSHVNDIAGVLAARGPAIDAQLKAFEAQTGHQVFVLTVPSTGAGNSIEAYALAVFEQWQPGSKNRDDGALLVIATGDRAMRIEAGYGLEGKLTDLQSARIVREVIAPKFRQGDIEGGVADGVDAMLAVIAGQPLPAQAAKPEEKEISGAAKWIVLGIFGCLALFALGMSLFAGVFGLLASIAVAVAVVMLAKGDSRGAAWAGAAVLVLAWLLLRWKMVAANVRKYHLPKARHKLLAWLKVYLFAMGFARGGPQRKREGDDRRRSDSDSDSDSSGSSSSESGTSDTSGGGGRSGGGGASGSW